MEVKNKAALRGGVKTAKKLAPGLLNAWEDAEIHGGNIQEELRTLLVKNSVRVIDLFRVWDEDNDGMVSKNEFWKAMPLLGINAPHDAIDKMFDSLDLDRSGYIEYQASHAVTHHYTPLHTVTHRCIEYQACHAVPRARSTSSTEPARPPSLFLRI